METGNSLPCWCGILLVPGLLQLTSTCLLSKVDSASSLAGAGGSGSLLVEGSPEGRGAVPPCQGQLLPNADFFVRVRVLFFLSFFFFLKATQLGLSRKAAV